MSSSSISEAGNTVDTCIPSFGSIHAAEIFILSSIAASSEDFCLKLPRTTFFAYRFQGFLDLAKKEERILRYSYYPDECVLQVIPRESPVHSAFYEALSTTLIKEFMVTFSDETLEPFWPVKHLNFGPFRIPMKVSNDDQPAQHPAQHLVQRKVPVQMMNPDWVIIYRKFGRGDDALTVAVEVGFIESYRDLVSHAEQLLVKRRGEVNLVILVNVKEDKAMLRDAQKTREFRVRLQNLVAAFGNDEAKLVHSIDDDDGDSGDSGDCDSDIEMSELSSEDLKYAIEDRLNVDDWVGPLSADLEFWELKNGICQRRGQRFVNLIYSRTWL
jgi:hypothetical protein